MAHYVSWHINVSWNIVCHETVCHETYETRYAMKHMCHEMHDVTGRSNTANGCLVTSCIWQDGHQFQKSDRAHVSLLNGLYPRWSDDGAYCLLNGLYSRWSDDGAYCLLTGLYSRWSDDGAYCLLTGLYSRWSDDGAYWNIHAVMAPDECRHEQWLLWKRSKDDQHWQRGWSLGWIDTDCLNKVQEVVQQGFPIQPLTIDFRHLLPPLSMATCQRS